MMREDEILRYESRKRALVTMPSRFWKLVPELRGKLGDNDSEVIRNIVIAYLTEKGYFAAPFDGLESRQRLDAIAASVQDLIELLIQRKVIDPSDGQGFLGKIQKGGAAGVPTPKAVAAIATKSEQVSVSKYRLTFSVPMADKLGESVNLQYSVPDKTLKILKSSRGKFKVHQIGRNKSTRYIKCDRFMEENRIKKGQFPLVWDEKEQFVVARIE